jgi:Domain of unknown function (DUF4760)
MEQARKVCREILEMSGTGVKDIEGAMASGDRELRIIHMLNFLEEMAVAVEYMVADGAILRDVYGGAMVSVWRCLGQWALHYRVKRSQPNAWKNVESLYKAWS